MGPGVPPPPQRGNTEEEKPGQPALCMFQVTLGMSTIAQSKCCNYVSSGTALRTVTQEAASE